jgi:hypothetical protein
MANGLENKEDQSIKLNILGVYMERGRKFGTKNEGEPLYSDILELSKKKQITLEAARKELIRKAAKQKKE